MSLTVQQMVLDAKKLVGKLRDSERRADSLISQSETVFKVVEGRREYRDEASWLNECAGQRGHSLLLASLSQESRHLRHLARENRQLRGALDEYASALEMIMSKYRQQVSEMMRGSSPNPAEALNRHQTETVERMSEKLHEMSCVMSCAARADEDADLRTAQVISRLSTENRGLRQLLALSNKYNPGPLFTDDSHS